MRLRCTTHTTMTMRQNVNKMTSQEKTSFCGGLDNFRKLDDV